MVDCLMFRSAEIRELQNKCSAVDLEACVEQRWSCIHTVAQAKCALKLLFEMVSLVIECENEY